MDEDKTYAVFEMVVSSYGGSRSQGCVVHTGDRASALDFLKSKLGEHPTSQEKYLLVRIVPYRADIQVSVTIKAAP